MNGLGALGYLAILAGSSALSLLLVPLAMRVALRYGVLDHPGGYKQQESPVPYLGGVAIVVAFAAAVLAAAAIRPPISGSGELATILGLAVAISLVGLLDDLRGLSPWPRLAAVAVAAVVLAAIGVRVNLFPWEVADIAVTVIWVVGITNAFNLLDNMDGLSAGVSAIAAGFFFVIAALNGQFLVAALALALAGCALGFLRHNFHPAKIYMGDAGSLFLGFMLAVLGLKLVVPGDPVVASFVPILVLSVAIFDTTLVSTSRLLAGRNPLSGGRDHVSHRLMGRGLGVRTAVATVYTGAFGVGWLAVVMSRLDDRITAVVLLGFVAAVAGGGGVLAEVAYRSQEADRLSVPNDGSEEWSGDGSGHRDPASASQAV